MKKEKKRAKKNLKLDLEILELEAKIAPNIFRCADPDGDPSYGSEC